MELNLGIRCNLSEVQSLKKMLDVLTEMNIECELTVENEPGDGNPAKGSPSTQSRPKNYVDLVWGKITKKAQEALLYIANNNDGCTKEAIVKGTSLTNTRDLGGALSSVSRRCKALHFDLNVIYEKVVTAKGELYVMGDDTASLIKAL